MLTHRNEWPAQFCSQAYFFQVNPVNDEPPVMNADLIPSIECPEGQAVAITSENLYATDEDSEDMQLMFMLARNPKYGVVKKDGIVVDRFPQVDVVSGAVEYEHTSKCEQCSDHIS